MNLSSVIIADDDYLVIEDLKNSIQWEELGYRLVGTATNGQDALKLVRQYRPDLLITDIIMPSMNGLELIEQVRPDFPDMQILIITSYDEFEYAKTAIAQGVADYILKTQITPMFFSQRLIQLSHNAMTKKRRDQAAIRQSLTEYFSYHAAEPLSERTDDVLYSIARLRYYFIVIGTHAPFTPDRETFDRIVRESAVRADGVIAERFSDSAIPIRFVFGQFLILGFVATRSAAQTRSTLQAIIDKLRSLLDTASAKPVCMFRTEDACTLEAFRRSYFRLKPLMAFHAAFCTGELMTFGELSAEPYTPSEQNLPLSGLHKPDNAPMELERLDRYLRRRAECHDIAALYRLYWLMTGWLHADGAVPNERLGEIHYFSDPQLLLSHLRGLIAAPKDTLDSDRDLSRPIVVENAMAYIREHFGDHDISVQDIADAVNVSAGRLGVLFRKSLGKTINEYLTDVRIEHAIHLLENTSLKIYEVADQSGFNAPHYFSDIMYKKTGKRPIDYKRLPTRRRQT